MTMVNESVLPASKNCQLATETKHTSFMAIFVEPGLAN